MAIGRVLTFSTAGISKALEVWYVQNQSHDHLPPKSGLLAVFHPGAWHQLSILLCSSEILASVRPPLFLAPDPVPHEALTILNYEALFSPSSLSPQERWQDYYMCSALLQHCRPGGEQKGHRHGLCPLPAFNDNSLSICHMLKQKEENKNLQNCNFQKMIQSPGKC